jgi:hypothetical protein
MPSQNRDAVVDELVAQYPSATQALIAESRRLIRAAFPGAIETADTKARLICYSYAPGFKGVAATLILSKTGAKIGIPYGATLPDPAGLLVGKGKVHRSIAVKSRSDLSLPAVRHMLKTALESWQRRTRDDDELVQALRRATQGRRRTGCRQPQSIPFPTLSNG